ncbi:MAG TPA: hypothetical protein VKT82_09735 [Ktedonobacterales bacterium]|nr:hypothetical protein [Ktedonobacterales bacterium]
MVSDRSVPWHNRPPREFPAKRWLEKTYGFRPLPLRLAPCLRLGKRPFPAQVWLAART